MRNGWDWTIATTTHQHLERIAMMREIPYETTTFVEFEEEGAPGTDRVLAERGKALSLNISPGGMLLLSDKAPHIEQVLRINVPTVAGPATVPTLAEVRWVRPVPFPGQHGLHFVGVRFLI